MAATKCCVGTVHNFASSKEVLGINEQGDIWQWQGCSPKETRARFLRVRTILGHRNDECGGRRQCEGQWRRKWGWQGRPERWLWEYPCQKGQKQKADKHQNGTISKNRKDNPGKSKKTNGGIVGSRHDIAEPPIKGSSKDRVLKMTSRSIGAPNLVPRLEKASRSLPRVRKSRANKSRRVNMTRRLWWRDSSSGKLCVYKPCTVYLDRPCLETIGY